MSGVKEECEFVREFDWLLPERELIFNRLSIAWRGELLVTVWAEVVLLVSLAFRLGAWARKPQPAKKAAMLTVVIQMWMYFFKFFMIAIFWIGEKIMMTAGCFRMNEAQRS
jgi:hypothetical protein